MNDLSNKVCDPIRTEDLNLSIFNIITGINKSKTLTKKTVNVSVNLMEQNVIQINGGITISVNTRMWKRLSVIHRLPVMKL